MHNFKAEHFQMTSFFLRKEWFSKVAIVIILIFKHLHLYLLPAIKTTEIVYYFEVTFEILLYNCTQPVCVLNSCDNTMRLNIAHVREALKRTYIEQFHVSSLDESLDLL